MQGASNIATVEHALLVRNDRKDLFRFLADQFGVPSRRLAIQPRPRHLLAAPLHLRRVHAHMFGRLDIQPALLVRAMIDPNVEPRPGEVLVGEMLPRLPDFTKLHLRCRHVARGEPFVLPLDRRLLGKPLGCHCSRRHQKMRMKISLVRRPMRRMNGEIDRRPVAVGEPLREFSAKLQSLFGIQLVRQRDLEFARDARVLALVGLLGRVPQGRTILRPFPLPSIAESRSRRVQRPRAA